MEEIGRRMNGQGSTLTIGLHNTTRVKRKELLVKIIAYCLMPNHYYLLLRQVRDGGIVRFMQKLGTGYTMYFNERYKRNGVLFQGKFKSIFVDKEKYFLTLLNYIHLNPVEFGEPDWKEKGIKDWREVHKFLENYRWSSYLDYIGIRNFPSIIDTTLVDEYFAQTNEYKNYTLQWLKNGNGTEPEKYLTFE